MHQAIAKRRHRIIESKKALLKLKLMDIAVSMESAALCVGNPQLHKLSGLYRQLSQEISADALSDLVLEVIGKSVESSEIAVQIAAEHYKTLALSNAPAGQVQAQLKGNIYDL